jgi:hypothetical protein
MITTQQLPAALVKWSKNRRKDFLAMQSTAKHASSRGIVFKSPTGALLLSTTYVQRNLLGRSITRLSLVPAPRYTDAMSDTATLETESEILEQVIQSDTAGLSPEAARALLGFRFNPAAVARMNELAEKNREGTIAPSERALLERYVRVGNFLNLIHAKARCALA